jgi:hypothetical protein
MPIDLDLEEVHEFGLHTTSTVPLYKQQAMARQKKATLQE